MKSLDLTGTTFGRLKVIEPVKRGKKTYWKCICECGKEVVVRIDLLRNGDIKSCGCLKKEMAKARLMKHGETGSRLYYIWRAMKSRCENAKNKKAPIYKNRGIKVCDEWHDYNNFRKWAFNNGYAENLTIDRIDNDGNYCPENCRWVDLITQANNMRTNRRIEYNGETKTLAQWARTFKINYNTLKNRLAKGWEFERAVLEDVA